MCKFFKYTLYKKGLINRILEFLGLINKLNYIKIYLLFNYFYK
jgi:hypothetical protein